MLKSYLKIAIRNLRRNRGYTALNVAGLAVGLAACLLIALWVRHEMSYDDFHANADRLYRVVVDASLRDETDKAATTQAVLGHTLHTEGVPAIEAAVRLWKQSALLRHGERKFYEEDLFWADPGALTAFSFPLRQGASQSALGEPGSIVLSAEAARRYFPGSKNPVGQTLTYDDEHTLTVTGVLELIPATSQLRPSALVSMSSVEEDDGGTGSWRSWTSFGTLTYVLLREEASAAQAAAQLDQLLERRGGKAMRQWDAELEYTLEPITDVHLRSAYGGPGADGSITNVYIFSLVAIFILGIACVNYMNLATAQSARRAKEVGVRKAVGAGRAGLSAQFLAEAVLMSTAAGLLALGLARTALPLFEQLSGVALDFVGPGGLLAFAGVVVSVGLIAGAYPAFILSRYQPVQVLRSSGAGTEGGDMLRRSLVVLQFGIAIALIAATAVVFSQLGYMQRQDLGFAMHESGEILTLNFGGDEQVKERLDAVKQRFTQIPAVTGVAASTFAPASGNMYGAGGSMERQDGTTDEQAWVQLYAADADFIDLYGLNVIAGRAFSAERDTDSTAAYILNETAARAHGFQSLEEAIGREAQFWGREGRVIGVVEDFHDAGLQEEIPPLALTVRPDLYQTLSLRIQTDDMQQAVADVEAAWREIAPDRPFDYAFLDQQFAQQYRAEERFGRIFGLAAGLAIFVACLGLFGLAAYAAEQRTKEIGIRKALGASVGSIVALLSKDFARLVAVAFVVAAPVAWWAMSRWLEDFAYRIELSPWLFLLAGAAALLIALLTVSTQALRAATANPTDALRSE